MITINANQMMVECYREVIHVSDVEVRLRMQEYSLQIHGKQLKILALSKDEVLLEGRLEGVQFLYEK